MSVDAKVVQDKISAGKELNKEERLAVLKNDRSLPVGYEKVDVQPDPVEDESLIEFPTEPEDPDFAQTDEEKMEAAQERDAAAKKAEEDAAKKSQEEDEKDPFVKIERELAKPEGNEKLENFSDREKAYFYQMRRDRRSRQKAESERDAALFRESQRKQVEQSGKPKEEIEEDPVEALKKRDKTDFMTVEDVLKVVEKAASRGKPANEQPAAEAIDPMSLGYLKMSDAQARLSHPEDYDEVMELTSELLSTNPQYLVQVAQAMRTGGNPAEVSYNLIKNDPEFANLFPVAKTRIAALRVAKAESPASGSGTPPKGKSPGELAKEAEARKAQEAMEKNKTTTRTTGHVGDPPSGDDSEPSLAEYLKMSDMDFARLDRKTRLKILKKFG